MRGGVGMGWGGFWKRVIFLVIRIGLDLMILKGMF